MMKNDNNKQSEPSYYENKSPGGQIMHSFETEDIIS